MLSFLLELARIRLLLKLNRHVLKLARCQLKLARHVGKLACPLLKLTRISLLKSGIIKQKRDSKQYLKLLGVIIIRVWWRYLVESLHVNYQVSDGFIISYVYKVRC